MPEHVSAEPTLDVRKAESHEDINPYENLQTIRTELDLVKCSEDIENDLLEASLDEYQCVSPRKII